MSNNTKKHPRSADQQQLIKELVEALGSALSYIRLEHEEDFTDDSGEECRYEDGGNLSCSWCGAGTDWSSFDFQQCEAVLLKAGGKLKERVPIDNRAFLQQFVTREGAEAVMAKMRERLANGS